MVKAIDIQNGNCVRLKQGDFAKETIFNSSPIDMAEKWIDDGAERLHLVDLDGARLGSPINIEIVSSICEKFPSFFLPLFFVIILAKNRPNSNNTHIGIASKTWEITSGGVRIIPIIKANTIIYGLFLDKDSTVVSLANIMTKVIIGTSKASPNAKNNFNTKFKKLLISVAIYGESRVDT